MLACLEECGGTSTRESGFSLIGIIGVVAVAAVVAAVVLPMTVHEADRARRDLTRARMQAIVAGMIGTDPLSAHGCVDDMGTFPPDIGSLILKGSQADYTVDANGIGTGWNGPYVHHLGPIAALSEDLWGMPFAYDGVTPQLTSSGPDRQPGTADHIVWPGTPEASNGDLQVSVLGVPEGGPVVQLDTTDVLQVRASFSNNGTGATQNLTWNGVNFVMSGLHRGAHSVTAVGTGDYDGVSSVVVVVHSGLNALGLALEHPGGGAGSGSGSGS
jgi:type II secretory pathway pseudopilin PulG